MTSIIDTGSDVVDPVYVTMTFGVCEGRPGEDVDKVTSGSIKIQFI